MWPLPRYMLLHHHVCRAKMESLEPGQRGHAEDPRLAAGMHDCLVELGANSWGYILLAQHLWLCMAWMSSSSCESKRPRYWNTSTLSNTSPCTENCWRRASADRTAMSCWWCLAVPIIHSFVLICIGTRGSTWIPPLLLHHGVVQWM